MNRLNIFAYTAICAGLVAAVQFIPLPRVAAEHVLNPADTLAGQASAVQGPTIADRARSEQALGLSRPPVPLMREAKLTPSMVPTPSVAATPFVASDAVEPSVAVASTVAAVAVPPPATLAPLVAVRTRSEGVPHRSAPVTSEAKWRSHAMRGSTELAVTATP